MDQIVGQRWNLTTDLFHILICRLQKTLERAIFVEQHLHRVDVFDGVQGHMDDVAKAENGCSNLEEEAAGVPAENRFMSYPSDFSHLPEVKP